MGRITSATAALVLAAFLMASLTTAQPPKSNLYLLAGTPLQNETDSYPVTLYAVGPNGRLETVRQIFSKKQGLFDVRGDLEGRLYVMNQWQNVLSVIHESNPEGVDTVKGNFGVMYETAWGIVAPPGRPSSAVYTEWCNDNCWKLFAVAGSPTASPRISKGQWSLYRWFRYRGTPVTPRAAVIPEGNIAGGEVVLPDLARPSGGAAVKGKLARGSGPAESVGTVGAVPPRLPPSVGAHSSTVGDKAGWHQVTVRDVAIVADTERYFAFAAFPFYSKQWPVPVYVQNKATGRWRVIDSPFIRLWPRVFGSWLATTVEEPNPTGKESPGLKNERTLPPYAYETSDFPQIMGLYGTKTYMPGKLLLQNLVDGRKITIDTGQQDSEVLDVRKDGLVLYRVNDEIFSARIKGDKLSAPTLVVKGNDVPEVHWVFWSKAEVSAQPAAHPKGSR